MHYDGATWTEVKAPYGDTLCGAAFVSPYEGWAVGYDTSYRGVVYHYLDTHNVEPASLGGIKALFH